MRHWIWSLAWMMLLGPSALGITSEFVPIYEKALGHSLVGGNSNNDSLYSNPASAAFSSIYSLDAVYAPPKTFAVSILDTKTSALGGGLAYFRRSFVGIEEPLQSLRLNFSGRVSETVSVGITGKMLWGPINTQEIVENTKEINATDRFNNIDLGVFYNLGGTQWGAVLHNAISENTAMAQYREYSLGGRIHWQQTMFLSLAAQGKLSGIRPEEYSAGAEYVSPYFFSLKLGYRVATYRGEAYWSTGASFNSPRLGFHYALEIPSQNSSETEHLFGASLLL